MAGQLKFTDIVAKVQGKWFFTGTESCVTISNIAKFGESNEYSLDWFGLKSVSKLEEYLRASKAGLTLVSLELYKPAFELKLSSNILYVENPKLEFARIFNECNIIGLDLTQGRTFERRLGSRLLMGANCFIGNANIGDNVTLGHNVVIHDSVVIGDNVVIGSNTVIGSEGFGYVKDRSGKLLKFPHIAGVVVGSNVEIGCNTCIDRGSLIDTFISDGVKIDNLVHIAHNVFIGQNTHVIANAMIAGSVRIGSQSWIAPSVSILEHLQIGDNVTIGVGAVVTKDVPDNEIWTGSPARDIKSFVRLQGKLKEL